MADSSLITKVIEPAMIHWVSSEVGVALKKRKYQFPKTAKSPAVKFEVDGLSDDNSIAVFAFSSNSNKTGQIRKLFFDAVVLSKIPAKRRIMVFLEDGRDVFKSFYNSCHGLIDLSGIEDKYCPLDRDLGKILGEFRTVAKKETGDKGRVKSKVSRPRR